METIITELVDDQSLRDARGRSIASQQRRAELLAEYKTSGMTQKAFARHAGVNIHTFVSWLADQRRGVLSAAAPSAPAGFVEVGVSAGLVAPRAPFLEVVLRDGRIARGCDAAALAQLTRLLEAWNAMLAFPSALKIYLAVAPVDMRKQFNGLWSQAHNALKIDPRDGAVFAFANKKRDRVKLLYWDGTGVWVLAKRLEKGRFTWPAGSDPARLSLTPEALTMLLAGIDLREGARKAWYEVR